MKKMSFIVLAFTVLFFSCTTTGNKEIKDFENIFEITKIQAVNCGLPATQFKISYPDDIDVIAAKEGEYNPNYIEFSYSEDGNFQESLTIGFYESASIADDFINESLLVQYLGQYQSQLPGINVIHNGKGYFRGKELHQLFLEFEIVDEMYGSPGKYKLLLVLYPPDNDLENGVLLIFQATEKSKIIDISDFGETGKIGEVWKTFRFI
jgi:hypothetical protein